MVLKAKRRCDHGIKHSQLK